MTTLPYIQGRQRFSNRPQAMLWANNSGTIVDGSIVPLGLEIGSDIYNSSTTETNEFIILSDHNRDSIECKPTRIEQRQRMVNGRMRAYHVADKLTISTSWKMLPSRAYETLANFETSSGQETAIGKSPLTRSQEYTADGGAGGVELLSWYENYQGSFWVYLSYDKYTNFGNVESSFENLTKYNEVVEVFFSDFSYNIVKRGQYDFWDVSVTLEEV